MRPSVLVTGDVVLDCHLYGPPRSKYIETVGGAALPAAVLRAGVAATARRWHERTAAWHARNQDLKRQNETLEKWPRDLPNTCPELEVHLGVVAPDPFPSELHSYGVWTAHARSRKADPNLRVWRVEDDFGYGRRPVKDSAPTFPDLKKDEHAPVSPVLTVVDDGGRLFRHARSAAAWPSFDANGSSYFLVKMSEPLCQGELWTAMTPVMDRVIVIVSAGDIRRQSVQISRRLSWEQTAEDTVRAFREDRSLAALRRAAHVIVNFQSAGAIWLHRTGDALGADLVFDPARLEGDYGEDFAGNVYGRQTCLTAGVAYHLLKHEAGWHSADPATSPFRDVTAMRKAIRDGIRAGLAARRTLLAVGHGPVAADDTPGFPAAQLGELVSTVPGGFESATIPDRRATASGLPWTILRESELGAAPPAPLVGLAEEAALYGAEALSHVPALRAGRLFTVDRGEIQSLRTLERLIRDYEHVKVQKKPLSIGVFGLPGAGKSFGVRALAEVTLGTKAPFLEFNLSQFRGPEDLNGAFHRVRDAVLGGTTPVAFWDEFDSRRYEWLQYLLAPMQDGAFQEREVTHPIGKCVFVFAGGTSATFGSFGVAEPKPPTANELKDLSSHDREARLKQFKDAGERYEHFKLLKGPDFVSRLHGFLNVLGPTAAEGDVADITWPVRRARLVRTMLGLQDGEVLTMDRGLLHALLAVRELRHGARSLEKILGALASARDRGGIHRAGLPPDPVLDCDTNAATLHDLMNQFRAPWQDLDVEVLAVAIHKNFLSTTALARLEAESKGEPGRIPTIHPSVLRDFENLDEDKQASNRAAAWRIPGHLALIDFRIKRASPDDDGAWKAPVEAAITRHVERLARSEHVGWCAERTSSGWTYARDRDERLKRHPLLRAWADLSPTDQDKDRWMVREIPAFLEAAGYKAVPANLG